MTTYYRIADVSEVEGMILVAIGTFEITEAPDAYVFGNIGKGKEQEEVGPLPVPKALMLAEQMLQEGKGSRIVVSLYDDRDELWDPAWGELEWVQ